MGMKRRSIKKRKEKKEEKRKEKKHGELVSDEKEHANVNYNLEFQRIFFFFKYESGKILLPGK